MADRIVYVCGCGQVFREEEGIEHMVDGFDGLCGDCCWPIACMSTINLDRLLRVERDARFFARHVETMAPAGEIFLISQAKRLLATIDDLHQQADQAEPETKQGG